MGFILGISSYLFNCALRGFSMEDIDALPSSAMYWKRIESLRISWKRVERTVSDRSALVAHNRRTVGFPDEATLTGQL